MTHSKPRFWYNNTEADFDPKGTRERAAGVGCVTVSGSSTAVGEGVDMFDVRQAAHGAFAPSRPSVCLLAIPVQPAKPASRPAGGPLVGCAGMNVAIVHGFLNGTYYLVTYNRRWPHRLRARCALSAHGLRRASDCFRRSAERGAAAPMSKKVAVRCDCVDRSSGRMLSKLRRGGGS